ncbi:FAD-binding oxidoreductase [Bacillus sp. FJAT-49736]|uniref:FAD-binding oxidoreductase n=1 Tax=Bacillus sp. FJAT-49736 TaxID=2833582 RepID=UPI001BC98C3E|nr:FAD-binding oxidoreductase [Bacillus sp. FJAT-49736]MBS4173054.1 FAD-binding oxidoreductase [Bacillus sp. FJAT-49736]
MLKRRYTILILIGYLIALGSSIYLYQKGISHPVVTDKGRLLPITMKSIQPAEGSKQLQDIVRKANVTNDKISIAGMQHSQGGQTLYPNAILIDMKSYYKILAFDPKRKTITVQSGVTWNDIQRYINPYGLSIKVMQSQNIFTIGGSLSVNVHGRDIRNDALIDTVDSFRLINAEGNIINVSRHENAPLFYSVIGGYGLFGIILDVTLKLTDDELYKTNTRVIDYKEYQVYFQKEVEDNPAVKMHLARISVAPKSFLKEMYVTDYALAENQQELSQYRKLKGETVAIPKFFLGVSRYSDWGKDLFWDVQKKYMKVTEGKLISRNNVMRSDSNFMEFDSSSRTEVLQEYFVPVTEFTNYIDSLRDVLEKEKDFNLLNITVRFVDKNDEAVMSYAKADMFALVLLINQGKSKKDIQDTQKVVRKMIDVTLDHHGSYYLPYYSYPSKKQLTEAYPRTDEFFSTKKLYDPQERFVNLFYEEYGK